MTDCVIDGPTSKYGHSQLPQASNDAQSSVMEGVMATFQYERGERLPRVAVADPGHWVKKSAKCQEET